MKGTGEIRAAETWTMESRKPGGAEWVCFRDEYGDLFHFRRSKLMRGRPLPPYKTTDELTRRHDVLTLANASHISGLGIQTLREYIYKGELNAVKKTWKYGHVKRVGWLVTLKDLREVMTRRVIQKRVGQLDWDITAEQLMGEER